MHRIRAAIPSKTECCFKNTVAKQINTQRTKEERLTQCLFFNLAECIMAMCIPTELNTWILGQTFVEVSVEYRVFTISTRKLSLTNVVGLRS